MAKYTNSPARFLLLSFKNLLFFIKLSIMQKIDSKNNSVKIVSERLGTVLLNRSARRKHGRSYHFIPFKPVSGLFPKNMSWQYIMKLFQTDSQEMRFLNSVSKKISSEADAWQWFHTLDSLSLSLLEIENQLSDQFFSLLCKRGLSVRSLSFRRMVQRFGRCDTTGNIALSHYLYFLPSVQRQYVMLHEITHLIHPHHQPEFWKTLESFFPDAAVTHRHIMKWGPRFRLLHQKSALHKNEIIIRAGKSE